jgi:DNA uptake protein ComE-like DNA-binding protein
MMVVVAVVVGIAHHFSRYGKTSAVSNPYICAAGVPSRRMLAVKLLLRVAVLAAALLCAIRCGPSQEDDRRETAAPRTSASAPRPETRVDINHATVEELLKVPGMTRTWAGRIVRFRPYSTKLDLVDDGVVPSEVYRRIGDFVIAHRNKS